MCAASGHYMYRTVVTICTAHWSLCVPPVVTICTASGHYMYRQWSVYVLHSGHYMYCRWSLYVPHIGHYMYRQWSLYVLPVVIICTASGRYVYRTVITLCTASGHSMYRTVVTIFTAGRHYMYRTLVTICTASGHYIYRQWSLYVLPVVTICTTSFIFSNSTFCPHSVFMCCVWISEQTAIISLYSINRLVCITETECLLRGTDWVFIYNSVLFSS